MKLSNKKIDMILKLIFYLLPVLFVLFTALATESTTKVDLWTDFINWFTNLEQTTIFSGFFNWFKNNLTTNTTILTILKYSFYVVFVEFVVLFKNVLIWVFRFANNLIERGLNVE